MIELTKLPEPQWLIDHASTQTDIYKAAPTDGKPRPWRRPEILETLKLESRRKCMYCEMVPDTTGFSNVEHIKPKSAFPDEVLLWNNLGLVCTHCNVNKGDYWSSNDSHRLLNPYEGDVQDHLRFEGPMTLPVPSSTRGRNTIRQLKFTIRQDLLFARAREIENLDDRLRLWCDEEDSDKKELYREDVLNNIGEDREHSAVLVAHAKAFGFFDVATTVEN